jgi:Fur family iron response transcriptional regulator
MIDMDADFSHREDRDRLAGSWPDAEALLQQVGLRPTRQRVALARLMFGNGDRHFTAEMLQGEAAQANVQVSLATIYNTLNHFMKLGLLRAIGVDGSKTFFDTRTGDHHHFFLEERSEIRDIPTSQIRIGTASSVPEGYEISRVDVVIRLRRKR